MKQLVSHCTGFREIKIFEKCYLICRLYQFCLKLHSRNSAVHCDIAGVHLWKYLAIQT